MSNLGLRLPIDIPWREIDLLVTDDPLGRPMPFQAAHDWNKFFSQAVQSSFSSPDRYPRGTVDFWDLDVMKDALISAVPEKEVGHVSVGRLLADGQVAERDLDEETRAYLNRPDVAEQPLAELLRPGLHDFVVNSDLDFGQASELRRRLWEAAAKPSGERRSKGKTSD